MINYRNGKEKYKPNELGSLYIDRSKIDSGRRPIIYIGGQMEHRFHVIEQTGLSFDMGHNMFDGSWFYDYSVLLHDKLRINSINFADNLLVALMESGLSDVDLITESFGGLIGARATKSNRIHHVYAIHPPILGTPLANPKFLKYFERSFNNKEKAVIKVLNRLINSDYGFEKENYSGLNTDLFDTNKFTVISSSIDLEKEKSELVRTLYDIIMKVDNLESDGIVTFSKDEFNRLGINFIEEEERVNHFDAGKKEHLEYVCNNVLKLK